MLYIGIDPGLHGAIAAINATDVIGVWDMPAGKGYPEPYETWKLIDSIVGDNEFHIAIEQTQTRPGQGVVASHRYGIGFGVLMGIAYALEPKSIRTIYPKVWQYPTWSSWGGHMTEDDDTKKKTHQAMRRAWPSMEVQSMLVTVNGKLIDGRSDALGIATWCREVNR